MKTAALLLAMAASAAAAGTPISDDALQAAASYSASQRGTMLLVQQNGRIRLSAVANGASADAPARIYSGTKLFWIMAALAADREGLLRLDEPVSSILPEWAADPQRRKVSVRQLLDFTAGLEPNFALHGDGLADRNASALRTALNATPGNSFIYGPAALQVYHEALKRRLASNAGGQTPTGYLEKRVLRPLGLGPQRYLPDRSGNPLLAAGFMLTGQQWLRLGQRILRDGPPPAANGTRANPAFSLALWNNHLAPSGREVDPEEMLERPWQRQSWSGACLSQCAPPDLLASIGSGGQRLYIVPSQNLLVVRLGSNSRFRDAEFLRCLFGR